MNSLKQTMLEGSARRFTASTRLILVLGFYLSLSLWPPSARGADYFVASYGKDSNSGLSHDSPWRSLEPINKLVLAPGDRVLLEGGARFVGPLLLDSQDQGTDIAPITITSYGTSAAMIEAPEGIGLFAHNTAGIVISNLTIVGDGYPHNTADGISFINDLEQDIRLSGITIDNVEVVGFGKNGIAIGGWNGYSGFQHVRVTQALLHDNGVNGLLVYAQKPQANRDVYIAHVEAYRNTGRPDVTPHSGSGIILGGVEGGIIEWSKAYDNGRRGNAGVGIWTYDSTRVLIQYNESYDNHTAGDSDGGGFDLDGGVTHSTLQYNYSHDNDGAGYGLYQYATAAPWHGNSVRANLSINDGRRNGAAGIQIWNGGAGWLGDAKIYDNVVVIGTAEEGIPSAIAFKSPSHRFFIYDNAFIVSGATNLVSMLTQQNDIVFENNRCWSMAWDHFRNEALERHACISYFPFP